MYKKRRAGESAEEVVLVDGLADSQSSPQVPDELELELQF